MSGRRRCALGWLGTIVLVATIGPSTASALPAAGPSTSGPLVMTGSSTSLAIVRLLADAFMRSRPDVRIDIPSAIGSTGGIRAAADGAIAVGLTSRPLREEEKSLGLTVVPYARAAVVIAAHPSVPDEGLTTKDLIEIYGGRKSRWSDGRPIVVFTREPGNSSIAVLEERIPGFRAAYAEAQQSRRWTTLFTFQEMSRLLAGSESGMGVADLGALASEHLALKVLKVNGVAPTRDTVITGRYPLVKTLALVFRNDHLPPGARAFVDFARSDAAAKILAAHGYLVPGAR
jgi:phosphate transport system substrate-binding protein